MNEEPDNDLSSESLPDADSLLTAHALGELADGERATIEARLRESADERHLAEQTARLGKLLRQVAAESSLRDRSPELREAVLAALADAPQADPPLQLPDRFPRRLFWLPLSLAASLLVVCGALFALMRMRHGDKLVAQHEPMHASQSVPSNEIEELSTYEFSDENMVREAEHPLLSNSRLEGAYAQSANGRAATGPGAPLEVKVDAAGGSASGHSLLVGASAVPGQNIPATEKPPQLFQASRGSTLRGTAGTAEPGMMSGPAHVDRLSQRRLADREGQADVAKAEAELVAARANYANHSKQVQEVTETYREGAGPERPGREAAQALDEAKSQLVVAQMRLAEAQTRFGYSAPPIPNTESYATLVENPFLKPTEHPLSTFSIDVDTASYANVRRYLNSRGMPPADAVRIEELVNYFQYDYPQPEGETPFSITTDVADCPWNAGHRLLRVGLKGREIPADERPASNLVFLLDVSGSMSAANKLPLVKEAMYLLTDRLTENDRVSIVVYAGNSGLVLPPTNGTDKATIRQAIGQLVAGGSTNGGQGLQMAYDTAQSNFIKGGTNRVILATDGDFNVGIVDQNELVRFIEERAKSGVFLSALGFGVGNLKDGTLEKLVDKGNGNYAYIDALAEARRVLVEQLSGTLVTIAKDVKIQIEFNPAQAAEYRLIGYEDRILPHQDFHDDRKDAGEIGAGHTVTALYEIVPAERAAGPGGEPLKYQRSQPLTPAADGGELATIKLRYKQPDGQQSRLLQRAILDRRPQQAAASRDMNFAAAVAAFGMLLRESPYRGDATYSKVLALAEQGISSDTSGYRSEFIELVRQARQISGKE